jgi:UDP-glucose 4-epimerase
MTDAIILRLGNVYGEKQVPLGENQLIPRAIRCVLGLDYFEIYGDGSQVRDYVYVKDVAEAFFLASKSKESGIFYVGTGRKYNVRQVLTYIGEAFGKQFHWTHGEARDDREKIVLDITPTTEKLGWKPKTSLSKGIERTVKWWRQEYEKSKKD